MGPAQECDFLLSFPHDESAIAENRFCNGFFPERVISHPMLAVELPRAPFRNFHETKF